MRGIGNCNISYYFMHLSQQLILQSFHLLNWWNLHPLVAAPCLSNPQYLLTGCVISWDDVITKGLSFPSFLHLYRTSPVFAHFKVVTELGVELGTSCVLDKHILTKLYPPALFSLFFILRHLTKLPRLALHSLCSLGRSSVWFSSLSLLF